MLHDAFLDPNRAGGDAASETERRSATRLPCPTELVAVWHHDMETTLRYRIRDVSVNGMRIESTVPLIEGMTGEALRLLPAGECMNQAMMVAWCRPSDAQPGIYETGVRFL